MTTSFPKKRRREAAKRAARVAVRPREGEKDPRGSRQTRRPRFAAEADGVGGSKSPVRGVTPLS